MDKANVKRIGEINQNTVREPLKTRQRRRQNMKQNKDACLCKENMLAQVLCLPRRHSSLGHGIYWLSWQKKKKRQALPFLLSSPDSVFPFLPIPSGPGCSGIDMADSMRVTPFPRSLCSQKS